MQILIDNFKKRQLWGGGFWEEGYFVRTVGKKVTVEVICKYMEYHRKQKQPPDQLELFQDVAH